VQRFSRRFELAQWPESRDEVVDVVAVERPRGDEDVGRPRRAGRVGWTHPDVWAELGQPRSDHRVAERTPLGHRSAITRSNCNDPVPVPIGAVRRLSAVLLPLPFEEATGERVATVGADQLFVRGHSGERGSCRSRANAEQLREGHE
jgi:hypothetical protein